MTLSKSLYTRGLQCPKALWLKKHKKELLTPPDEQAKGVFETGNLVGELACELFPNGKEVPYEGTTFDEKIALTQKWIEEGIQNIYEATFKYDNVLVMVDILHINKDGSVEIYEVKSSTSVKEVYLDDASIQYYVLNGLGLNVVKTSIVHINSNYVRGKELDLNSYFEVVDVTDYIEEIQCNIPANLDRLKNTVAEKEKEPSTDIGEHCTYPYDCDAMAYCWKHVPSYSIFNIANLKKSKKFELYRKDVLTFTQIPDISAFSEKQQIQIASELSQKNIINKEAISEFVESLSYPLYHLDFETFQQPIPQWEGIKPFMQIPFQFSLHIEQSDGTLEHKEFLAKEGIDPRYALAKRLVESIPSNITVLAYNMGFEKGVIRKLAEMFPEFAPQLMAMHDNMQDLMTPFQKKDYYTPSMQGSYSIKYILPALVPEMAQAYKELEGIQNGGEAMQAFAKLSSMTDKETIEKQRTALLKYCKLDTLAMVKILQKLRESVENSA